MQFLWKYVDELVGKGLEIHLILELLLFASATFVSMAAPLAVLLSSLMTFGSLGERYEIVALKSAGIPISKLMIPLALLSVVIAGGSFWFSNNVSPKAYIKMRTLLYDIREQKPALSIEEGTFYDGFDNYTIRIGKKHRNNETIEDVLIYDHSKHQGNTTMTYAKKGTMKITPDKKYMLFILYNGYFWDESQNNNSRGTRFPLTRAKFKEQYKRFDLSSFQIQKSDESFFKTTTKALPIKDLTKEIDTLKKQISLITSNASSSFFNNLFYFSQIIKSDTADYIPMENVSKYSIDSIPFRNQERIFNFAQQCSGNFINSVKFSYDEMDYRNIALWSYQIEWHRKFTLAVACVLFFFIGAPLGSIIRKGGIGIPLVVTIVFFTFYFVISIIGEKVSKGSLIPVNIGMWFSTFILIPICAFLTNKATIDSAVLSTEEYAKWIKKFNFINKSSEISK